MSSRMNPGARSPACREFLGGHLLDNLSDSASQPLASAPGHAAECASCRDHWLAAHRVVGLLRGLAAPALPEELRSPGFLARIHESSLHRLEVGAAGQALQAGILPVAMPEDRGWEEAAISKQPQLRALQQLEPKTAPGWLWARIRSDLRVGLSVQRRQHRRALALRVVAASLLVSGLALLFWSRPWLSDQPWSHDKPSGPTGGTISSDGPVRVANTRFPIIEFVQVDEPISSDASPSLLVRDLARTPTSGR